MSSNRRLMKMGEEIKKVVSVFIMNSIKDPRVSSMTTVTGVEVTSDLSYAKIYISVLGSDKEKKDTLDGLNSAKGLVRKEIGRSVKLRHTPEPIFELDKSLDHGMKINEILKDINKK